MLPVYPEELSESAERQLKTLGAEVLTGTMVSEIDDGGVPELTGESGERGRYLSAAGDQASIWGHPGGVVTDEVVPSATRKICHVPGTRRCSPP